ncbi:PREDICTED: uncharacterized protein LOC101292145 [Fragaria vesca subsp. vesca]|uniref:uncharacterized protein LOC101292145 n=1 Tax=Fragaria vesca subsp. vesca TaxID=101020 RepID=UPI0002C36A8F|nr:PREDICTED: uncharacterized protein LOC101292145 [Fragaria vesca subsp. vesca]
MTSELESIMKANGDGGSTSEPPHRSRKRRNICLAATAAVVVTVLILVIFCLTVFKAKDPETTENSVVLRNLQTDFNINRATVDVNITLDVDMTVKNPNKLGMKYTNSTALLNYRGELVGQAPIVAGDISAGETKSMDVTLTVMADRFLGKTSELLQDVIAGSIPFNTVTKISGKVTILGIFKVHVVSTSSCDFNVHVGRNTAGDQKCTYKTKL